MHAKELVVARNVCKVVVHKQKTPEGAHPAHVKLVRTLISKKFLIK